MFSSEEIERYARHIVLNEVGGAGQQKLKSARVLVIGAGGLGSPVLHYLAAAGVGTIGIVDDDRVSLSNLQRQVIHPSSAVGLLKTESAAETITGINPHVSVEPFTMRIDSSNAADLVGGFDVVADGSDNFDTRYCVSDACFHARKTLVTAAVGRFDGSVTTLKPWLTNASGELNPTYRCLFPEPPSPGTVPSCAEAGILGGVTGVIGSLQALEVLKEIVGFGDNLVGRLLLFDSRAMRFDTIRYRWNSANPLSGTQ